MWLDAAVTSPGLQRPPLPSHPCLCTYPQMEMQVRCALYRNGEAQKGRNPMFQAWVNGCSCCVPYHAMSAPQRGKHYGHCNCRHKEDQQAVVRSDDRPVSSYFPLIATNAHVGKLRKNCLLLRIRARACSRLVYVRKITLNPSHISRSIGGVGEGNCG